MTPQVSVIIPTFNRPVELRRCLEGFARQTVAPGEFEVVLVDDGSDEDIGAIASGFRARLRLHFERREHAGVSVARNVGLERAQAPLIVLYDDDLEPLPDLIESRVGFHAAHAGERQMELLYFTPAPELAELAVTRWAFERLYPFPAQAGVYREAHYFWGGAASCKRALFAQHRFDPDFAAVEDAEFAVRAGGAEGLEIHFEPRVTGHFTRPLDVIGICQRQYRMAYHRQRMAERHGIEFPQPFCKHPEECLIADWAGFRAMLGAMRAVEASSPRYRLMCGLWRKAELHALASGTLAARAGLPPAGL
jgi:glycosyltransferase involved in cell wall biosynthesis